MGEKPITLEELLQMAKSFNFGKKLEVYHEDPEYTDYDPDDDCDGGNTYYAIYHFRDDIYVKVQRYVGSYGSGDYVEGFEIVKRTETTKTVYTYE